MHVLFVTGEYPPMQGGVGAYTAALAQHLQAENIRTSVVTSTQIGLGSGEKQADYPRLYPHISRWGWRIWGKVARLAREIRADWIHVQYQTAAFGMHPAINLAPAVWRRQGLAVAWTYHDLLVPYLFPKAGSWLRRWITERPAFTSRFVVVTNEGDRRRLSGRVANLAKIPIGSNVPGQLLTPEERRQRRTRRGYGEEELVVGYFGFLNRSKGGLTLVRTLHELVRGGVNAHLLMIGERVGASDPTNYAYLQEVEGLIRTLGLERRVQWTGRQPDGEVSADLGACDVLFMPYEDGASLRRGTLMAGLANGCPVVTTTPQAPLPELVDGRDLLFVPPGDPVAGARAIRRIAADAELAQRLRENARERSLLFRWESIARRHRTLYARFLPDPPPGV